MSTTVRTTPEQKHFRGTVVSDRGQKTIMVSIEQSIRHPLYGKRYRRTRNFPVHDPKNQYHIGDVVEFVPCRPISKRKRWRVIYPKEQSI